jgi:hypothetical protein
MCLDYHPPVSYKKFLLKFAKDKKMKFESRDSSYSHLFAGKKEVPSHKNAHILDA